MPRFFYDFSNPMNQMSISGYHPFQVVLPIITALAIILGFSFSCLGQSKNNSPEFTILTFNVNYGYPNKSMVNIIDSLNADLVCLQETNAAWESLVRSGLVEKYPYITFRDCCGAGGLAILSRFPVVEVKYAENHIGWFPAWTTNVIVGPDTIQVMNVHLKPGINENGKVGFLGREFFRAQRIHRQELEYFLGQLPQAHSRLIVGDFNENDGGKGLKWLTKERGYQDALRLFDRRSKTWRWGILRRRYDHLVFNSGLGCLKAEVFEIGTSDHLPVLGKFKVIRK